MGNAASAERAAAPRDAHRLTKPRTYNPSPSPQLGPQSALSSFDADDVVWTSAGSFRSKQDARQQIRMQLFGPHEQDADDDAIPADNADRLTLLSQSGSNPPDPAPAMNERTVDVDAAIAILQELKKSATPDQLVALRMSIRSPRQQVLICFQLQTRPSSPPRMSRLRPLQSSPAAGQWPCPASLLATPPMSCAEETTRLHSGAWSSPARPLWPAPLAWTPRRTITRTTAPKPPGKWTMPP